jgi:hypothetical protein
MKKIAMLLGVLVLAGCSSSSPTVNLNYTNRVDLPEMPRPMTLLEVYWNVQNIPQLIEMLKAFGVLTETEALQARERAIRSPHSATFSQFSLDGKNYESLVVNMAEIKRYLEQQRIVIDYFIQATEPTRTTTNN